MSAPREPDDPDDIADLADPERAPPNSATSPRKARAPRPRRIPRTQAAQAKLDAVADLFRPEPFEYDPVEAGKPIEERIAHWFSARGWQPFEFQQEMWREIARGASGLLHATTGAGKTWAVWIGALATYTAPPLRSRQAHLPAPLTVLWITPMRALAADSARALQTAAKALSVPWTVGLRTGDTSSTERARQNRQMPSALVTTPESLSLMLTRTNAREELAHQARDLVLGSTHPVFVEACPQLVVAGRPAGPRCWPWRRCGRWWPSAMAPR